jgi:predicted permease
MDTLFRDLRYALRHLVRRPAFTVVAVASLALGIGANTAIFSVVNAFLIRDLAFTEPERLVEVYTSDNTIQHATSSYLDYQEIAGLTDVFSDAVAYNMMFARVAHEDGSELVPGEIVTGNYFETLGIPIQLGRGFLPEEDRTPGTHPVVVISDAYWRSAFGGSPDVLGREVRIGSTPFTVVGVTAPEYKGMLRGISVDLWTPMMMTGVVNPSSVDRLASRGSRNVFVKARLSPGTTPAQADAAVSALSVGLAEQYPETNEGREMAALPTLDVAIHPMVDGALYPVAGMLLAVVGLVLLIACANLASFLLARAAERRKEIALRLALGASRGRLVRQLLTETSLLALLGGMLGLVVAKAALDAVVGFQPPIAVPLQLDLALDRQVLLFTALVSAAAGVMFGLAPALQSTKPDVAPELKGEAGSGGRPKRLSLRNALVVGQVALSMVLLIGAGLFVRSLVASQRIDPGLGYAPAALVGLGVPAERYGPEERAQYFAELRERVLTLPGVQAVGLADMLPLGVGVQTQEIVVPEVPAPEGRDGHDVDQALIDAGYLDVIGVEILSGRGFGPEDVADSPPVAVVNQAFANRFWPGVDPVGRTFRIAGGGREYQVVGVSATTKVRTLGEAARPQFFRSFDQMPIKAMNVLARVSAEPEATVRAIRALALELDRDVVVFTSSTLEQHLGTMLFPPRMAALLLGVFGALALVLALIGLYGLVSFSAARRTREVGIRMSLGANATDVVVLVMRGAVILVGVGVLTGTLMAFGAAQAIRAFLVGIAPSDATTFALIPLSFIAVATFAAWVPARRASRVDPVDALRSA